MQKKDRTFYEIIRTGQPWRLYFDLEYDKIINQNVNQLKIMDAFREKLINQILNVLGIDLAACFQGRKKCDYFIELDSSNYKKFSRHVVAQIPGESFFANNKQIGKFVLLFYQQLLKEAAFSKHFPKIPQKVKKARIFFLNNLQK